MPAATTGPASDAVVFLHYWTDDFATGVDGMLQAIRRGEPSLHLQGQGFEHEAFKTGVAAMLQSQEPPDLFSYWAGQRTQMLVDRQLVAPVDEVWRQYNLQDVFPPAVEAACTYNGVRYGVPVTMHWVGFIYDKALFRNLNLEPPRTWKDFLDVCEAIRRNGRAPVALGLQRRWPAQFWFDFLLLRTAGPEFREALLHGRASFTDARVRRAFVLWQELKDRDFFLPQAALYDWAGAVKAVHSGEAGMTLMGSWAIGQLEQKLGWQGGKDFGVFAFPEIEAGVPRVQVGPVDLVLMSRKGRHPQRSAALAAFAATNAQKAMSRGFGCLAPSRLVPPTWYSPIMQEIQKEVAGGGPWVFAFDLTAQPPLAQAGLQAFEDFHLGRHDVDETLRSMQRVTWQ
ncbi:ABC transporter substrate-binding protein [Megalodesulfovibrio paquesii]